ncbi:MAG: hypothetical protein IPK82_01285 [Polyangiaceae bacterium]|nr:hypothetical protein [Polyangiaceae bacterium]
MKLGGPDLLHEARDVLGDDLPVLDYVLSGLLEGNPPPPIDGTKVAAALHDPASVLVVGLEAFFMDALVVHLTQCRIGLVLGEGGLEGDLRRIIANYEDRVELVKLGDVQRWAGNKSALCTFVYGVRERSCYVQPIWLRMAGSDIRTQFRTLVGWDVLGAPTPRYPRWLVETSTEPFSRMVTL